MILFIPYGVIISGTNNIPEDIMQPGGKQLMQKLKAGNIRAFDILVRSWEHRLFNLIHFHKLVGGVVHRKGRGYG
jgi:hypothetical protein